MNKRIIILLAFISFLSTTFIKAQGIGIGEWRDHLSYYQTNGVAAVGEEIYVVSPYGLFIYNKTDYVIDRFSKINGLTDHGFSKVRYNKSNDCLMIMYSNSDIDIIKNGTIYNIPYIKLAEIIADKTLNNVCFEGKYAYVCCGFGIVVIDLDTRTVVDTYKIGDNGVTTVVYDLTYDDSCFYAATATGIYKADKDNNYLSYYESWEKLNNLPNVNGTYKFVEFYNNSLVYALSTSRDSVYRQNVNEADYTLLYYGTCYDMNVAENQLIMVFNSSFIAYKNNSFSQYTVVDQCQGETIKPRQVVYSNNTYWIADYNLGLIKASDLSNLQKVGRPNGPYSYNSFSMSAHKNSVWVSAGYYIDDSWMYGSSYDGASHFDGSTWTSFNTSLDNVPTNTHDMCLAIVNPNNTSQSFVGTWGCGLYQFDNNQFTIAYNENNSTLQPRNAAVNQGVFVSGLDYDSDGNLWVANSSCNNMLSRRSLDGTWTSYNLLITNNEDIRNMIIDENDQKWILTRYREIIVFKESSDGNHSVRRISLVDSEGSSTKAHALALDKNGTMWVGTNNGVLLINNPDKILNKSGNSFVSVSYTYPKIVWDGYTRLLLSGEIVTSIVVNGNNDKWISTKYSGVYKISEYGTEQLEHFTTDDSPLYSDDILDMCQTANGELFIGTANGIISYRDEASEGKEDNSEVYIFPNPVKSEYNGYIAITNIADKSYIKITDISGTLVYNCQANGGQAVWDGKNLNGQRVKTGVYLVFIANSDGTQTKVSKIMFLN